MFGSGSGSQQLKAALALMLGVVTVGVGVALTGLGDGAASAKPWLIGSLVISWLIAGYSLLTSGGAAGGSLQAATDAAEALAL